jgi:hypothetical protein
VHPAGAFRIAPNRLQPAAKGVCKFGRDRSLASQPHSGKPGLGLRDEGEEMTPAQASRQQSIRLHRATTSEHYATVTLAPGRTRDALPDKGCRSPRATQPSLDS